MLFANSLAAKNIFAHVDCDCFFVSVERLSQPALNNVPVCVCGPTGNSGVVTCASYEARPFGIRAGTPVFKAKKMCPQAKFISGSFQKYIDISYQLFKILEKFSPEIEHKSIDEGYLNINNIAEIHGLGELELANKIQETIKSELNLPISIGIGPTKTLAKIGSKLNKPAGIKVFTSEKLLTDINNLPINIVCGFGRKLEKRLLVKYRLTSIGQFLKLNGSLVNQALGLPGLIIWHELQGTPLLKINCNETAPKSILRSSMFPNKTTSYETIENWLHARLEEACRKLDRYNLTCQGFGIFLRQNYPLKVGDYQQLATPTNSYQKLSKEIHSQLKKIYRPDTLYRAAGVWLDNLKPQNTQQTLPLYEEDQTKEFVKALTSCDQKIGKTSLMTASRFFGHQKPSTSAPLAFLI